MILSKQTDFIVASSTILGFYSLSGFYHQLLQGCGIVCYDDCIALKFDRHLGTAAAEELVEFQGYKNSPNPNIATSRLHEIFDRLVNRGPESRNFADVVSAGN